jgi:shikimate dehydrogenase
MPAKLNQRRSCVIGWPIGHSRSPLIHNYWLKLYGLEGEYTREPVTPGELETFLKSMQQRGYIGCNVTVPLKEQTASLVALADPLTRKLAAVNTVFIDNSTVLGTNTDGLGFTENLKSVVSDFDPINRHIMILGAGGAARAIIAALLDMGVRTVFVCNRSIERVKALVDCFGAEIRPLSWANAAEVMASVDLLVNATSLGMAGKPELDISIDALPRSAVVYDIVYVPLETALLRRARARGHRTVDGLGMLLHQARPGFEKWFGVRPDVTAELRQLVERDILTASPQT